MSSRDTTTGFRHGLRVRIGGLTGQRGVLLLCEKRDGTGRYWKVRLNSGEWVWPDQLVADGLGAHLATCADCNIRFVTADPSRPTCDRCEAEARGTAVHRFLDADPGQCDDERDRRFRRGQ